MVVSVNRYLTVQEMTTNAQYIMDKLITDGWTKNAVAGMLGNMETESTINPGIWQNLDAGNTALGFGLVQWTPATKYITWANENNYAINDIDGQLARLQYEIDNGLQWIPTTEYPMSFAEFKISSQTPEYLAQVFLKNYERPQNQNQPNRSTQARYWFDTLDGEGGLCLQLAQFPMDMLYVTQGENGSYSHMGTYCMDFVGTHDRYPVYAPVDCECLASFDDITIWRSITEVMCADGQIRKLFWSCIHEEPLTHGVGTILYKGELMTHTGVGGNATGDHLHLQVMEGDTYLGFIVNAQGAYTLIGTELHIYDVFAVNGVTIVQDGGYTWVESNYKDCSEPPIPPKPDDNKQQKIIMMLLSDALNGWKY